MTLRRAGAYTSYVFIGSNGNDDTGSVVSSTHSTRYQKMQPFSVQNSRLSILALTLYAENSAEICAVIKATTYIFLLDYAADYSVFGLEGKRLECGVGSLINFTP